LFEIDQHFAKLEEENLPPKFAPIIGEIDGAGSHIFTVGGCGTHQAGRQEMKWGGCFFVKSGKWRCFVKRSAKWGCFVKSGPFLNARCIMYSISIFYFTFYLFGGCVRTQRTPPLAGGVA